MSGLQTEKVTCQLCGKQYRQITATHLLKAHGVSFEEYRQQFPNSETLPREIHETLSEIATQKVANGTIGFSKGHVVNAGKTPWNKGTHGLQTSTRKGKTKDTDESIRKSAMSLSVTRKRLYAEGKLKKLYGKDNPMHGKRLSDKHKSALWGGWKSCGTKPELKMRDLLSNYPSWEYTANGKFFIRTDKKTRVPDFVNRRSKKVIEVYGDYWHRGENPQDKINEYKRAGWDCVVVWEHEIMDDNYSIESLSNYL